MRHPLIALAVAATTALAAWTGAVAEYPSDTVRVIVPWRAGGGTDTIARGFAAALEEQIGQAVVVDNLTGGNGNRAHMHMKKARPDGLQILLNGSSDMNSAIIFQNTPYNYDDFACLGAIYRTPTWILSHKETGITSIDQFFEAARGSPGELTVGVGSLASAHNVLAQALMGVNEIDARVIPFDGGGPLKKAILGNQVSIGVIHSPVLLDAVKSGDVNVIGSGGSLADIVYEPVRGAETIDAHGVGVEIGTVRGLFVPRDTPEELLEAASALMEKAAKSEAFATFGARFGFKPIWWDRKTHCDFMAEENAAYRKIKADYID